MSKVAVCPGCATEFPPSFLACPGCQRLLHADDLKRLAAKARETKDPREASLMWREALALLPPSSSQHATVSAEIARLTKAPASMGPLPKQLAALGTVGLLAWKFKFVLLALLSKGKLLLLGFTKLGTLGSMFAFLGVLWAEIGWPLAVGLVLSIYVHEMGHVAALKRVGLPAEAPMFIPGLGALVRLKHRPVDDREDADIGLAGPVWGLGAALVCWVASLFSPNPLWPALTSLGAMLNLFNLMPVWQLDGSRGIRPLNRTQRWLLLAVIVGCYAATRQGLLILIGLVTLFRSVGPGAEKGDSTILGLFAFLLVSLSLLAKVSIPV